MQADQLRILELRERLSAEPAPYLYAQLAEEYRRAHDFDEAVACCRACLARYPAYLSVRVILGRALAERDELDAAAAEFEHVLANAPDNLTATRDLAEIDLRRGYLDRALGHYQRALALFRHDADLEERVRTLTEQIDAAKPQGSTAVAPVQSADAVQPAQSPSVDFDALLVSLGAKDQSLPPLMEMLLSTPPARVAAPVPAPLPATLSEPVSAIDAKPAAVSSEVTIAELERWLAALQTRRAREQQGERHAHRSA